MKLTFKYIHTLLLGIAVVAAIRLGSIQPNATAPVAKAQISHVVSGTNLADGQETHGKHRSASSLA